MEMSQLIPVFICGHYRSGTSLLHHLLDGHSQIISAGIETNFFTGFIPNIKKLGFEKAAEKSFLRIVHSSDEKVFNRHLPNADSSLFDEFYLNTSKSQNDPFTYLEAFIEAHAKTTNQWSDEKRFWIEKTPLNELFVDEILDKWPNARFIHVMRDPRNVHASVRLRSDFPLKVRTTYHNWDRSYRSKEKNLKKCDSRYMVLRYEDMVTTPSLVMNQICSMLGVNFEDVVLSPTLLGGRFPWGSNSLSGEKMEIDTSALNRWKSFPHQNEIRLLEALAIRKMKCLGYKIDEAPGFNNLMIATKEKGILLLKELRHWIKRDPEGTY